MTIRVPGGAWNCPSGVTRRLFKEQPQACCQQASIQSQSCAELEVDSEAVTVSPPAAFVKRSVSKVVKMTGCFRKVKRDHRLKGLSTRRV